MAIQTSIVVPVFNSSSTVIELVEEISKLEGNPLVGKMELILVNDGSIDNVGKKIREKILTEEFPFDIQLLEMARNYGQKGAILAGWKRASGEIIIQIDDDLQWSPGDIPEILSKFSKGTDVVYARASPMKQKGINPFRIVSSWLVEHAYRKIYSSKVPRSSFYGIRKAVAKKVISHQSPFLGIPGVVSWYTNSFDSISVKRFPRKFGSSGHSIPMLFKEAMDIFVNQSIAPLITAVWLGFSFSTIGLFLGVFYMVSGFMNYGEAPGWASIFVSITLFSSVILFILALMSEYLGRMHITLVGKPQYSISSTYSNNEEESDAMEQ